MIDHHCPHRGASLFFGRNEEGGLRCVYHGWKFDVDGRCVDMPNVPARRPVQATRYRRRPTRRVERNGLIWAYMGPRAEPPPLPMIEVTLLPATSIDVQCVMRECNWLQALEGDIDTSHFGFLHAGHVRPEELEDGNPMRGTVTDRAPRYHVRDTRGARPTAPSGPAARARRTGASPTSCSRSGPSSPRARSPSTCTPARWVPLDDHHTMFINITWREMTDRRSIAPQRKDGTAIEGLELRNDYLPNTTDWLGRWRLRAGPDNDWLIDRAAQHEGRIYTGIRNIHLQDQAVTESMGPITDFSREHLSASDQMIARTRRRILGAARAFRDHGSAPPAVDDPEVSLGSRSGFFLADESVDWLDAYAAQVARAERPAGVA